MGQSPASESYNFLGDGLPFYQGVTEFGEKYISVKSYTNAPTKIVDAGSILFSVRAPVGRVNITKKKCCIGRGNAGLIMKNGEQEFLYYLLKYLEKIILKNTTGTVFDSISGVELRKFPVSVPESKNDQKQIAAVLSSLDDKIELLRRQNETLEKIAQRIFKEWFVNFTIDGKKLKLKNGVPEGWRVGKMSEGVKICGGTTPNTKNLEYWNGNISWTSPKDLSNCKEMFLTKTENKITEKGLSKIGSGLLPVKTLLLSSRAPIGYLALTNIPVAINQGYIAFLPDGFFTNEYMYLWLKLNMDKVVSSANGSTFLEISKASFRNIEIIIPEKEALDNFQVVINPIFDKILNNINQIQTLSRLRDTLLPKLMSGDIKVKNG